VGSGDQALAARLWRETVAVLGAVLAHDRPRLAAALTYYTVLSLFPVLIVVVALLGLVGLSPDALRALLDAVGDLGAPWAVEFVSDWRLLAGAAVGVGLWIVASAGFSVYLTHFATYNRVYGALGAAVAFLVWAWAMNLALLLGVEVNRELEWRTDA